jgi:hypothetical protein
MSNKEIKEKIETYEFNLAGFKNLSGASAKVTKLNVGKLRVKYDIELCAGVDEPVIKYTNNILLTRELGVTL